MAVKLLSLRAYARHRKCDEKAVRKAVAEGRISAIDGQIDPEVADIQWAKNTRARVDSTKQAVQISLPTGEDQASRKDGDQAPPDYQDSRARRERAEAEKAELEAAKMAKRLVDSESVQTAVFDAFRQLRDRLMTVPRRAAPSVLGMAEVRDIEMLMADEIRSAFEAFEQQTLASMAARIAA